mmetsp:Transcript_2996/g.5265  ORF Transcript_2996/g.5265 Transcript_2996/m.5265 type:complete len:195 (-) Transcript_2996:37-621(-)
MVLSSAPDEVIVSVLSACDGRCQLRALSMRWSSLINSCFKIRCFPSPSDRIFSLDFEIDRPMSKDVYCANFKGKTLDEGAYMSGEVSFLNWAPVYYRSARNEHRNIRHRLCERDTCAMWRLLIKSAESIESNPQTRGSDSGHLMFSEGMSEHSVKHKVGRVTLEQTELLLNLLDHRRNAAAEQIKGPTLSPNDC